MNEQVKKIRDEIERLKKKLLDHIIIQSDFSYAQRCAHQLNKIIRFIDALQEEPVSEDLEKEIDRWSKKQYYNDSEKCVFAVVARHFAEWQKQHMMKDAVDATIPIHGQIWIDNNTSYKAGDKVKVIITKED